MSSPNSPLLNPSLDIKVVQETINQDHPFGLKLWKPALYKKNRSIAQRTYLALHSVPTTSTSLYISPGNIIYTLLFGSWISLVYLLIAIVGLGPFYVLGKLGNSLFKTYLFDELEAVGEYIKVLLNMSRYMLFPFGRFVTKKKSYKPLFRNDLDDEQQGLLDNYDDDSIDSERENGEVVVDVDIGAASSSRTQPINNEPDESEEFTEDVDEFVNLPPPRVSKTPGIIRYVRRTYASGLSGILYQIFAVFLLLPIHTIVSGICFFFIVTVPMARFNSVFLKHMIRYPLLLAANDPITFNTSDTEPKVFHPGTVYVTDVHSEPVTPLLRPVAMNRTSTDTPIEHPLNPGYSIILCTNHAMGAEFFKYTYDGVNIIFINLLAVVVFTLTMYYLGKQFGNHGITSHGVIFCAGLFSVIPLAYFIGMSVSSITAATGNLALGAVINATFGSIIEVILYCLALMDKRDRMVEGSIIGSFLLGLLALPGASMFSGGLKRLEQRFNAKSAGVTSTMLIVAIIGAFTPTIFQQVYGTFEINCSPCKENLDKECKTCRYSTNHQKDAVFLNNTKPLIIFCTVVLVLTYAVGLWFTLRTHSNKIYPSDRAKQEKKEKKRKDLKDSITKLLDNEIRREITIAAANSVNANAPTTTTFGGVEIIPEPPALHRRSGKSASSRSSTISNLKLPDTVATSPTTASPTTRQKPNRANSNPIAVVNADPLVSILEDEYLSPESDSDEDELSYLAANAKKQTKSKSSTENTHNGHAHEEPSDGKAKSADAHGGHGGHDNPNWGTVKSSIILLGATILFALIAEALIDSLEWVLEQLPGLDEKFIGLTLFAIVPSVTEFYNAIAFAMNGNIALSLEIGSAYTIQVALLQLPLVVFFSHWFQSQLPSTEHPALTSTQHAEMSFHRIKELFSIVTSSFSSIFSSAPVNSTTTIYGGHEGEKSTADPFTLLFPQWDVYAVLFSVFMLTYIYIEGKSNYFKGSMLLLVYAILVVSFLYVPYGI